MRPPGGHPLEEELLAALLMLLHTQACMNLATEDQFMTYHALSKNLIADITQMLAEGFDAGMLHDLAVRTNRFDQFVDAWHDQVARTITSTWADF